MINGATKRRRLVTLYRADKREFAVDDLIAGAGDYYRLFSDEARLVERALESARPAGKPFRQEVLFLFEDLATARKHWSKMTEGKLYAVEVHQHEILHRADMSWLDCIAERLRAGGSIQQFCQLYWAGELTSRPEVEILVLSARVKEVMSNSEAERRAYLRRRHLEDSAM